MSRTELRRCYSRDMDVSNHKGRVIELINNKIHRPVQYWTKSVHELLKHLETVGFSASPRVLGFDEHGREVLSYIQGESGADSWVKIVSDGGLRKYAKLLRSYHDAVASFVPGADSIWAYSNGRPLEHEIMCHGDFGPWNVVWQSDEPVGIIDWDMVVPAQSEYDLLYALQYAAPFCDDTEAIKWRRFDVAPDRKHRIAVFCEAYGAQVPDNITDKVASLQRKGADYVAAIAKHNIEPQLSWLNDDTLDKIEQQAQWTEEHRELFQ